VGWVVGLAVVGTIVLLAASGGDASEGGEPATWVDVVKLVLGGLLALLAVKQWRGRPREGDEAALPKWMQAIDTFAPGKALGMGARAERVLDELKRWMAGHNAAIMAVLCLVIGAKLIGDGISGLA
jgi:hypothetical protein